MLWLSIFCSGLLLFDQGAQAQTRTAPYNPADVRYGVGIYTAQCSNCHGLTGDSIPNVDLRLGRFRRASSDADLRNVITSGIRGTAMPPFQFNDAELAGIVAYLRSMGAVRDGALTAGDAGRGRKLFEGAGNCTGCHCVDGKGSRVAPDLSKIGAIRTAGRLEQALLDPTGSMLPMNRSIRAVTRDGKVITGRRLNEDTYSAQLIDSEERLRSLSKADLREYVVLTTSTMPSYKDKFDPQQLADMVSYLLTLRGIE